MLSWGLIISLVVIALLLALFLTLGDNQLKEAAGAIGSDSDDYSAVPNSRKAIFGGGTRPSYVPESEHFVELTKGFDISLLGEAQYEGKAIETVVGETYAIKPIDFIGMAPIPKMLVEVGQKVKAGDGLFFDKAQPEVIFAAPISGEILEIRRGDKRAIHEVIIKADAADAITYRSYQVPDLATVSQSELLDFLSESGALAFVRQRPYDLVANPKQLPKDIFVSTFDTAPLAPNLELALKGRESAYAKGLEVLTHLTAGKVHLGLDARDSEHCPAFANVQIKGVVKHWFKGQHPAGNVGIHIHHVNPINAGDVVWYLDIHAVILIGTLFEQGVFDTRKPVAVVGTEVQAGYVLAHQGIALAALGVSENGGQTRIVSGDVLSGSKTTEQAYLNFYDDQVSTLKEGNYFELFGWLVPQKGHPTVSGTFPGAYFPDSKYEADTNTNGEHRAFVMSGQYESVLPMDILPQYLFRAIMVGDLEQMEGLGILELSEEDVALCEYVCTSKQSLQQMLRDGLENMRAQEA